MAKVYMLCGRICSGKSTYAAMLRRSLHAVVLNVDEVMLTLFGQDAGEKHDFYSAKVEQYMLEKSVEIVSEGIDVVLDWGFWSKEKRDCARRYYQLSGVECELHYINISKSEWQKRIEKRNKAIKDAKAIGYIVDDGLMVKCESRFETPEECEIAVRVKQ